MADTDVKTPGSLHPALLAILELDSANDKNFVYCSVCSHVLTRRGAQIEMQGSFDHQFSNPHGFRFHVGCFANALGCDISGAPQAADSWFMGYAWRLATCGGCHQHLGWYFTRGRNLHFFYGLILDRVQIEQ